MISKFRNIIIMSSWYSIAICSTMIMYTLLPILYTQLWWSTSAGLMIMIMTIFQIFVFWPIAANFVDKYWARKMLFVYAWFFILWAIAWLWSYINNDYIIDSILTISMTILFAAWYGSRFVDVYTLRMSPAWQSWMAFGRLVTFAWLGRFLWTLLQPHLISADKQIRAPLIMIWAMITFIIVLSRIKDDQSTIIKENNVKTHVKNSIIYALKTFIQSYKRTFSHWWIFIQRCKSFPLIPLSIALFEWILFWSIRFIIPLYLAKHPEYVSYWFEIWVYEVISVICAVLFWYIADKYNSINNVFLWWLWALLWILLLYLYPTVDILVTAWIIIGLSNSLLYATGQHILSEHDEDHEDDWAYWQTRSMITNIWYMIMPVVRWILQFIPFNIILQLLSSILSCFILIWIIIAFYVLIMKRHTLEAINQK